MKNVDKQKIIHDHYIAGMSIVALARRYVYLFAELKGGWDVVCKEVEKILREARK